MKKLIALAITAVMVLSMIPVMAISTVAADVVGDWTIYRDPEKYEVEEGEAIKPDPGYHYTEEGFTTLAPDWTNYTPFFTAQTKEPQPLKEGFYMQVRIDEYAYGGEDGGADHWICFNIADKEGMNPGSIDFNNNWLCLVRGNGDGNATLENFLTTKTTDTKNGSFALQGRSSLTIPMDDSGREIYTFEVTWDGTAYDLRINGTSVSNAAINNALKTWVESGEYYVGITLHSGVSNATQGITILKCGKSESEAVTPVGTDSLDPEDNMLNFAPKADPATVEENMPALLWDATKTSFRGDPKGTDVKLVAQGDDSYHVTATGGTPYWTWSIKSDVTYSISDFPVFCMAMKGFWGDTGGLYYCAGDILVSRDTYSLSWNVFDPGCLLIGDGSDEYSLVVVDLTTVIDEAMLAQDGRIHNVRPSFSVTDVEDASVAEWDVCYMGWFRSVEEAQNYFMNRLNLDMTDTEAPVDTTEPAPETTATPETTAAPETNAPETNVPETNAPETDAPVAATGCASVVGFSAVAVMAAAAAFVALKKKD